MNTQKKFCGIPSSVSVDDREAWLAERKRGLGASDASAICGLNPWKTDYELALDKLGKIPSSEITEPQLLGLKFEHVLSDLYSERTGRSVIKPPMIWHETVPFMLATLDRVTEDGERNVELKLVGPMMISEWGEPGTDEIPKSYLIQTQHQMEVSGISITDVAALLGGTRFAIYTVYRSRAIANDLISLEESFWRNLQAGILPEPSFSNPHLRKLIKSRVPTISAGVELADESYLTLIDSYQGWKAEKNQAEKYAEEFQARLITLMGDHAEAYFADGTVISRPEVQNKGYTVDPYKYRSFRVKRPRGTLIPTARDLEEAMKEAKIKEFTDSVSLTSEVSNEQAASGTVAAAVENS